jgi:ATP-dependent Clp protease ATP-binding subunit ClpA
MGGRGIGNLMEDKYINPLAEYIFEADCREGDTIQLSVNDEMLVFQKQ